MSVRYLCDKQRHMICAPYSIAGLHAMALDLKVNHRWFHRGKFPHYDMPKARVEELTARCELVSPKEIVRIIKAAGPDVFRESLLTQPGGMSGSEAEERLRLKAEAELRRNWPGARIIHELVLEQGGRRIDLAAVTTDRMVAVEIKSERDTLERLKPQLASALPVAAEVWLCIAPKHVESVAKLGNLDPTQPDYVGLSDVVILVEQDDGLAPMPGHYFHRRARNPWLDPRQLVRMLWADELRTLARLGERATRGRCIEACLEHLTGRQIRQGTYAALRARRFPRADPPRNADDHFALSVQTA